MTKNLRKLSLLERLEVLVFNKITPVLVGYETGVLSGGDIPVFQCPACGREFTTGHHCKCGLKLNWSKFRI
jgi:hypothetical protein